MPPDAGQHLYRVGILEVGVGDRPDMCYIATHNGRHASSIRSQDGRGS